MLHPGEVHRGLVVATAVVLSLANCVDDGSGNEQGNEGEGEPPADCVTHIQVEDAQTGPTAIVRVAEINGQEAAPGAAVSTGDTILLSLDQSLPSQTTGSISGFHYEIVSRPEQSEVALTTPSAETTGLTSPSGSGFDVAGCYAISGAVFGDDAMSENLALATFDVAH